MLESFIPSQGNVLSGLTAIIDFDAGVFAGCRNDRFRRLVDIIVADDNREGEKATRCLLLEFFQQALE
jgi:hypothetical protein